MNPASLGSRLALVLASLIGYPTLAATQPITVVVETRANSLVTADDVRAAITEERRSPVVAPLERAVDADDDILLVAVDAHRAVLTFRPQHGEVRQRSIALPAGRESQLRTLAWIALNLTTDQTDKNATPDQDLADRTGASSAAVTSPGLASPTPDAQSPNLQPPPVVPQLMIPAQHPATKDDESTKPEARWSMALLLGPRMFPLSGSPGYNWPWKWAWAHNHDGNEYEVELQRHYADVDFGVALDMGSYDSPIAGLAVFAGNSWRWRRIRLDGSLGAGIEVTDRRIATTTQGIDSRLQGGSYTETTLSTELRPVIYGRGNLTFAWQVGPAFALLARAGIHIPTDSLGLCYVSALLGLRLSLP